MRSWIEVSGARLVENLRAIQAVAGDGVEVLAVVKANGYGHGAAQVARALASAGVAWLGVSDVEEGVRLRAALGEDSTRILVMCGMEPGDAPAMVAHGLTPVVWTAEHVAAVERAARAAGSRTQVHVEVDTGMSRQGLPVDEPLAKLMAQLATARWVSCEGVMSHLACAEDAGSALTALQRERFGVALAMASQAGLRPKLVHLGNSSAVDEGSTMSWLRQTARAMGAQPMVRPGLALYGYALPVEGGAGALRLRPVLTWKTRVIGVREVAAGTTVGYGATFVAPSSLRLALLPVGYADGFRREASSGIGDGWVCIAGHRASVVGRVSMNLTTVDVSGTNVGVGDEVVLLGEGVSAEDHARWCGTIPYEILCGLRARFQTL